MVKPFLGLVVVLATVSPALTALADPLVLPSEVQRMATDDCAQARAKNHTCVLSIEEEGIEGGVPRSGETAISLVTFTHAASLITLRRDFIPEIVKTAEGL